MKESSRDTSRTAASLPSPAGLEGQPLHRNGVIWVLGPKPIQGGTMYISIGAAILILILLIIFVF